ncbi:MAG: hypothetical protein V1895_01355 [Parcubacteria group bacterium]
MAFIETQLSQERRREYYVTGDPALAEKIAREFFGFVVHCQHVAIG